MDKKEKLIQELKKESEFLKSTNNPTFGHTLAIKYLKTGIRPSNEDMDRHSILHSAVNDYETLLSDYVG